MKNHIEWNEALELAATVCEIANNNTPNAQLAASIRQHKAAEPVDIVTYPGCAVGWNGVTYHNVEETYHQAEQCEALHMWLDAQGVPRAAADGQVLSPVGRVAVMAEDAARFRWLNDDHVDIETREKVHGLAKRLGTSSYFAITRDIDAAIASGFREGRNTNPESVSDAAPVEQAAKVPTSEQKPIGTVIDHDRFAGESTIDVYLDIGDNLYAAPIAAGDTQTRDQGGAA